MVYILPKFKCYCFKINKTHHKYKKKVTSFQDRIFRGNRTPHFHFTILR